MKVLFLAIIVLLLTSCGFGYDFGRDETRAETYKGIITKKYRVLYNHNSLYYTIKVNDDTVRCDVGIWSDMYRYAKIGDSVIKKANELKITVKKNDSTFQTFPYEFRGKVYE